MEISIRANENLAALSDFGSLRTNNRFRRLHSDDGMTLEIRTCSVISVLFFKIFPCCFSNSQVIARAITFTVENLNFKGKSIDPLQEGLEGIYRFIRQNPELSSDMVATQYKMVEYVATKRNELNNPFECLSRVINRAVANYK